MKRYLLVFTVLVFGLGFSSAAEAGHGPQAGCHKEREYCEKKHCPHTKHSSKDLKSKFFHKTGFILEHAGEIGLSEEQVTGIEKIKIDTKKNAILSGADIDVLKLDIHRHMKAHPVDVETLSSLVDQKYEAKKAAARVLAEAYAAVKNTLNEEQYQELKSIWKSHDQGCPWAKR